MASEAKKNKARNSYIHNGGEKNSLEEWKCRGTAYFTKRDRANENRKLRASQDIFRQTEEAEDGN